MHKSSSLTIDTGSNHTSPPKRNSSILMLNESDLELDNDDEIVVPYEILNPNESILPLVANSSHHISPKGRSTSFSVKEEGQHQPGDFLATTETDFDVLPVEAFREEILETLRNHQIMICIGETGSGKTTQIPQFILKAGLLNEENIDDSIKEPSNESKKVVHLKRKMAITQPRRIAAISVAKRVSEEVGCELGEEIGYIVRFDDMTTSDKTKIRFMTDGILIRECLSDPLLSSYSIIMLDEAHERSLNTDILFGLLKDICRKRKDLKLIITSATLDADKFSSYFHACPILQIPGRTYPVDIYHSKTKQIMTANGPANNTYVQSAVDVVLKIHEKQDDGHILVFLTGQEEIEKACLLLKQTLKEYKNLSEKSHLFIDRELIILPLYSALSNEEQIKIFQKPHLLLEKDSHNNMTSHFFTRIVPLPSPANKGRVRDRSNSLNGTSSIIPDEFQGKILRKCVIATNIAETSITVPHVRYVVDAGYIKQKVYDPSRGMESLVIVPISKISALQRAGRAGRTASGQCYRLYSSECFDNMMDETIPEIQRTNLG
jgi:ATP-dependent RNA helicase DHX8/PRP22